jgi:isochorismate pyruvate lyase
MQKAWTAAAAALRAPAMTDTSLEPAVCMTMTEVRTGVDAVDAQLVALLVRRFGYMDAAARIKSDRGAVRDEGRKADVLAKVRAHAAQHGLSPDRIAAVWDALIEQSIAHEFDQWDATRD